MNPTDLSDLSSQDFRDQTAGKPKFTDQNVEKVKRISTTDSRPESQVLAVIFCVGFEFAVKCCGFRRPEAKIEKIDVNIFEVVCLESYYLIGHSLIPLFLSDRCLAPCDCTPLFFFILVSQGRAFLWLAKDKTMKSNDKYAYMEVAVKHFRVDSKILTSKFWFSLGLISKILV